MWAPQKPIRNEPNELYLEFSWQQKIWCTGLVVEESNAMKTSVTPINEILKDKARAALRDGFADGEFSRPSLQQQSYNPSQCKQYSIRNEPNELHLGVSLLTLTIHQIFLLHDLRIEGMCLMRNFYCRNHFLMIQNQKKNEVKVPIVYVKFCYIQVASPRFSTLELGSM